MKPTFELRNIKTDKLIKTYNNLEEAIKIRKVEEYIHRVNEKEYDAQYRGWIEYGDDYQD